MQFDEKEDPHRRFNPLNGEFILISPHRSSKINLVRIKKNL